MLGKYIWLHLGTLPLSNTLTLPALQTEFPFLHRLTDRPSANRCAIIHCQHPNRSLQQFDSNCLVFRAVSHFFQSHVLTAQSPACITFGPCSVQWCRCHCFGRKCDDFRSLLAHLIPQLCLGQISFRVRVKIYPPSIHLYYRERPDAVASQELDRFPGQSFSNF